MALNKQMLKKVKEKTKNDKKMLEFIVSILQEENKGIGWYTKVYRSEIDKATLEDSENEN